MPNQRVAIAGGGPAGCAVALALLKRGFGAVSVFAAPCTQRQAVGETLPPPAKQVLARLGVVDILEDSRRHPGSPGSLSVWNSARPGAHDFFLTGLGCGWHLDRAHFDRELLDRVRRAGGDVSQGRRCSGVRNGNNVISLEFVSGAEATVDFVVDATGKASQVARRLGIKRNSFDEVLAVSAVLPLEPTRPMVKNTLIEAVQDGWWYASQIRGARAMVSFYTDKSGVACWRDKATWWRALQATQLIWPKLPCLDALPKALQVDAAPSSLLSRVVGEQWLAVGDAAASYDPISSAGILKALLSGEAAGDAIARHLRGDKAALVAYQDQVFRGFEQYAALRYHLYASEQRFPSSSFWRARTGQAVPTE
jgi:flavin-dependent dehydrogenase